METKSIARFRNPTNEVVSFRVIEGSILHGGVAEIHMNGQSCASLRVTSPADGVKAGHPVGGTGGQGEWVPPQLVHTRV